MSQGLTITSNTSTNVTVIADFESTDFGVSPFGQGSWVSVGPNRHERRKAAALARKDRTERCIECGQPNGEHTANCLGVN